MARPNTRTECVECGALIEKYVPPNVRGKIRSGHTCSVACRNIMARRIRNKGREESFAARFWSRVDKSGGPMACWPWTANTLKTGYGLVRRGSRTHYLTHRVALELDGRPVPDGMFGCHHCDNPSCCNPRHLYVGTQEQNVEDKTLKGKTLEERIALRMAG